MASETYNRIPPLIFYETYPVYAPGREPAGYFEKLKRAEPETVFNAARLHTPEDWSEAGEAIFDAPTFFENASQSPTGPQWYAAAGVPVAESG